MRQAAASFKPLFQRQDGGDYGNVLVNGHPWVIELDGWEDRDTYHLCMETTIETIKQANIRFLALKQQNQDVSEGMLELIDCVPTIPDFRKRIMRAVSDTTHDLSHLWGDLLHVLGEGE